MLCRNIFSPIFSKNKKIFVDEWVKVNCEISDSKGHLLFLRTDYDNVIFTDDEKKKC